MQRAARVLQLVTVESFNCHRIVGCPLLMYVLVSQVCWAASTDCLDAFDFHVVQEFNVVQILERWLVRRRSDFSRNSEAREVRPVSADKMINRGSRSAGVPADTLPGSPRTRRHARKGGLSCSLPKVVGLLVVIVMVSCTTTCGTCHGIVLTLNRLLLRILALVTDTLSVADILCVHAYMFALRGSGSRRLLHNRELIWLFRYVRTNIHSHVRAVKLIVEFVPTCHH